jgi:hypothetical protein
MTWAFSLPTSCNSSRSVSGIASRLGTRRRPAGAQGWFGVLVGPGFFSRRVALGCHPSIPLFHGRFGDVLVRSVQVGCSRFRRCCHLILDLLRPQDGSSAGRLTRSPELGFGRGVPQPPCVHRLSCWRQEWTAVAQRFVRFPASPTAMQQNSQLPGRGDHESFPFFERRKVSFSPQRRGRCLPQTDRGYDTHPAPATFEEARARKDGASSLPNAAATTSACWRRAIRATAEAGPKRIGAGASPHRFHCYRFPRA